MNRILLAHNLRECDTYSDLLTIPNLHILSSRIQQTQTASMMTSSPLISPLAILLLVCTALDSAIAGRHTQGNSFDDTVTASLLSAAIQQAATKT